PLVGGEDLAAVDDGEVVKEEDEEGGFLTSGVGFGDGGDEGEDGSAPDDGEQGVFAVGPPEERGHAPDGGGAELLMEFGENLGDRLHAFFADEAPGLASKRDERDEIDEGDGAGEE